VLAPGIGRMDASRKFEQKVFIDKNHMYVKICVGMNVQLIRSLSRGYLGRDPRFAQSHRKTRYLGLAAQTQSRSSRTCRSWRCDGSQALQAQE